LTGFARTRLTYLSVATIIMIAFFAVPVLDWPKNRDGTSALNLRYVSKFICKCNSKLPTLIP